MSDSWRFGLDCLLGMMDREERVGKMDEMRWANVMFSLYLGDFSMSWGCHCLLVPFRGFAFCFASEMTYHDGTF